MRLVFSIHSSQSPVVRGRIGGMLYALKAIGSRKWHYFRRVISSGECPFRPKYFIYLSLCQPKASLNKNAMRNLLLSVFLSLFVFPLQAQEAADEKVRNNELGLMATDLINGGYLLSYERAIGKHIGLRLGFGYKGREGLVNLSGIDRPQLKTNDLTYSGLKLVPEFRYYLNEKDQGMARGFYFGAYVKFVNYSSDLVGTFIDSQGESFDIAYDGKINVLSTGLLVGYKLQVSSRFGIDFLIAGPGAGNYNFKLDNRIPPPDEFYDVLNEALENYSIFDLINADFEFRDNKLRQQTMLPVFRYGIALTYAF